MIPTYEETGAFWAPKPEPKKEPKWLGNMTLAEQREVYDRYVAGAK